MSRKGHSFFDYGIEEEIDPRIKFNSLISVTASTVMCIAARCPLPKSNVETTKLFLSTITDDNGKTPRNIRGLLSVLNNYSGPYESDSHKEKLCEKPPAEKPKEKEAPEAGAPKSPLKECGALVESPIPSKRSPKATTRKMDKDATRKAGKPLGSKISVSKSLISKF